MGRCQRRRTSGGRRTDEFRTREIAPQRRFGWHRLSADPKLLLTAETEVASSTGAYFRTSLYDYQKVRTQARYQLTSTLNVALDFTYLNNENPTPGINYSFKSQQEAASLFWSPENGKRFTFQGSYSWATLRSDALYLIPQTLTPATSAYRENANTANAMFNVTLPHWGIVAPRLTAGGSLFLTNGTRPTSYYQPMAKLWIPVSKRVQAFAEWCSMATANPRIPMKDSERTWLRLD